MYLIQVYVIFNGHFFPHRDIKTEETEAIVNYLDEIFRCDLNGIYPEAFTHTFMKETRRCVSINQNNPGCNLRIPTDCNNENIDVKLASKCHVKVELAHRCYAGKNTSDCDDPDLQPYINRLKCFTSLENSSKCLRDFENKCNRKRIGVTKVHRLSMQSVAAILERIPDIYIVYYVRDPRGIYVSRKKPEIYIQSLCKHIKSDYDIFTKLKQTFPKRLQLFRYEDLATHPNQSLEQLFTFVDEPIPTKTKTYLSNITKATTNSGTYGVKRTDSTKTASAWREKLEPTAYETSKKECAEILDLLDYEI